MKQSKCMFLCVMLLLMAIWSAEDSNAQAAPTPAQCGQIIDAEFLRDGDEGAQEYTLSLAPGDTITVFGDTVGAYLRYAISVFAPTTGKVARADWNYYDEPRAESDVLSERGIYTIRVWSNGPGLYTLYIGCTLRDGTVISPGDVVGSSVISPTSAPAATLPPNVSGFPGLAPVDMSNAVKVPLIAGTLMTGIVTPTGNEIIGFSVEANAGDTVDLSFRKLSGNLNLGVVVLSPTNKVVFYGGLILSDSLSTRFTLQDAGQYTIAVYRVDLLPPAAAEATAFQVQGAIVS